MKIAITSTGNNLDSELDPRFGRAQYILILDPGGNILEVIDNAANRQAMGGAGIQAAKMLADRKVDLLLTGRCGPNAVAALGAAGIQIGEVQAGTAKEALESFNRGQISIADNRDASMPTRGMGGGRGMGGRGRGRGGRGMGGG